MKLEYNDTIREFYKNSEFQHIPYAEFVTICKAPFYYMKVQMERGDMPDMYFKYFAKLKVTVPKLKTLLRHNDTKYHFHNISKEMYEERKAHYNRMIERLESLGHHRPRRGEAKEEILVEIIDDE